MTMKETMDQELAEAIATLEKANSALARIFNVENDSMIQCDFCGEYYEHEGEGEDDL